jgi:hypothetical protein
MHNFYRGKNSPKNWMIAIIFIKVPKVNNDPLGEHSHNLATLLKTHFKMTRNGFIKRLQRNSIEKEQT